MSAELSSALRQAVANEGTPLRVIDSVTGQTYLLIPESAWAHEDVALSKEASLTNDELLKIASRLRPPREWLEDDEEDVF